MIGSLGLIDAQEFMHFIIETAQATKFKEEVINYLDKLAQKELGLEHPEEE